MSALAADTIVNIISSLINILLNLALIWHLNRLSFDRGVLPFVKLALSEHHNKRY